MDGNRVTENNGTAVEAANQSYEDARSLVRRIETLEQAGADKDRALDELNETSGAFKLLNEKQVAELNAKDILLARKNERIEELVRQLQERDNLVQSKDRQILQLQLKTQELERDQQEIKDQLTKEEEEFSMLSVAMETKEQQLSKKTDEVATLKDVEKQLHKDMDRLQVQMRKLEKHVVDLQPATMDACLSPRSFSENQLIQLRDDAINAKTKEIWILAGKNDQLRIQLDELEAELERLQTSYVSKENDVARRDRKIEKLEAAIEALQVSRQQAEGRERAIEIATTQNTKLLQALQAMEVEASDVKVRLDQAERECLQLRQAHRQNLEKSAVNEVEVLHKSKEVEHKSSMLGALQEKLARERKALHEELTQERMKSQLEVEKLQSELVMRRNKQYELTLRLQEVEAKFHHANDEQEQASEQLIVTKLRMEEAERVLQDALMWKRALEDELVSCRSDGEQKKRELEKQISGLQSEVATLRVQLNELKESLIKTLDDGKKKEFRIQDLRRNVDSKDLLLTEQKERISRLVHEVAKGGQARAALELEQKLLSEQLERVKVETSDALRECMEQQRRVEEKYKKETAKVKALEKECTSEQQGKSKVLRLFLQAYAASATAAATATVTAGPQKLAISSCLDLRECWLADHDIAPVFSMLETHMVLRKHLTRVDLRSNRVTQEGLRAIIRYLRQCLQLSPASSASCVRELDLRANFVSIEGIRMVANALESLASPDQSRDAPFAKVMVVSGGRIECYPDLVVSNNEIPVLTVDMSENGAPETLHAAASPASDYKQLNRRRRDDGGPAAGSRSAAVVDPVLQEIYGLDLVSAFMGDAKPAPGPASSRVRRKSTERTRLGANNESDDASAPSSSTLLQSRSTLVDMPYHSGPSPAVSSPRTQTIPDGRSSTRPPLLSSSASLPRL